jgi:hypothetical protein
MILTGKPKYSGGGGGTWPKTPLSAKISTWTGLVLNLGPLREKLVTNCWNLGAAAFMNRVQNRK